MRKNSKRGGLVSNVFILIAVVVVAASVWFVSGIKSNEDMGEVVAEVNGSPIYEKEVQEQLNALSGGRQADFSALNDDSKFLLVREVAVQKIILEEAIKENVQKNSKVLKEVKKFQENVVRKQKLTAIGNAAATEEALKKKYEEMVANLEGRKQVKVSHILVRTKKESEKIAKTLRKDKSKFEKLAKEKSIDKKTAANGGSLNYLVTGSMVKEFEEVALKLKVGSISKPFETKFGWHVIRLEDIGPAQVGTFEEAKPLIKNDISARAIQAYVKEITDSADIKVLSNDDSEEETDSEDDNS